MNPIKLINGAFSACIAIQRGHISSYSYSGSYLLRTISMASATSDKDDTQKRTTFVDKEERANEHTMGNWYSIPDLQLRDHRFTVPLDYKSPASSIISVFAREVVGAGKEEKSLPCLLFLQGGPGFESPRPLESSGWLKKACEEYRVILLDQRGTGLSTPLTVSSLSQFSSAKEQADFLQHFRADNIVNDAEFIRVRMVPNEEPWTVLGQSYGGFCAVTYLSFAPEGLKHVLLTGGLPPLDNGCAADSVYRLCLKRVMLQNQKYYERFPQDIEVVREVILHLAESQGSGVPLPSGGILTSRGLQLLGLSGLGSSGGFERLHYMFERAWDPALVPGTKKQLSYAFMKAFENWIAFDTNPLYAMMHESIYCQGAASRWSAHRIIDEIGDEFNAIKSAKEGRPVFFTGEDIMPQAKGGIILFINHHMDGRTALDILATLGGGMETSFLPMLRGQSMFKERRMVFPWIFDEIAVLRPLKEAASILAEKEDWPLLYDIDRLKKNQVPVAAAVYYEDMYVNFSIAEATASQIAGIRLWITNEYMHSGLRDSGSQVFDYLMCMLKGKKPIF